VHIHGYALAMSPPDSRSWPVSVWEQWALDLSRDLGVLILWTGPQGFLVRGRHATTPQAVRAIAGLS